MQSAKQQLLRCIRGAALAPAPSLSLQRLCGRCEESLTRAQLSTGLHRVGLELQTKVPEVLPMVSRNQIGTLALEDTFNQEKAIVGAVTVIVKVRVSFAKL